VGPLPDGGAGSTGSGGGGGEGGEGGSDDSFPTHDSGCSCGLGDGAGPGLGLYAIAALVWGLHRRRGSKARAE
jgi:MYXO-CTERM domain-containing protein